MWVRGLQDHHMPRDLLGFHGLSIQLHQQLRFIAVGSKNTQPDHKGKRGGVCRNPGTVFCMCSNHEHMLPLTMKMQKHVCNFSVQRNPIGTKHLRFQLGPVMQAPSAQCVPQFKTPRRKAGLQCKPHSLYSLSTVSLPYQCGNGGNKLQNPNSQLPVKS